MRYPFMRYMLCEMYTDGDKALRTASFRDRSTVRLAGEVRYAYMTGDGEVITTVRTCG
jgi:hypothetical protein